MLCYGAVRPVTGEALDGYWPFIPCPQEQYQKSLRKFPRPSSLLVSKVANKAE